MTEHREANKEQGKGLAGISIATTPARETFVREGIIFTINPELDRFSGDGFLPEKHKEAEARLANRVIPDSLSSSLK